ncbi:MAG TPA: helix-turn-helix domain-containing protein [Sphingomicrobium sp.]
MDETEPDEVVTVGQRLREAREAKGLSLEDIAAQTRIPTRHLMSLEASDWDKLPAATYSVGFAKNYAGAVDLDRNEIGEKLRAEMGGTRPPTAFPEVYEAVDPARTMPKGLVIAALALLALVALALTWLNNRSQRPDPPVAEATDVAAPAVNQAAAAPATPPITDAQVMLTATEPVWIQVRDSGTTLHQGELAAGQSYTVPASAVAPLLTTGKPEALRIMVGSTQAPPVGQPGRTVSGVSLKGADLLGAGAAAPAAASPQPAASTPVTAGRTARSSSRPAPPPAETPDPGRPEAEDGAEPDTSGQTENP